MEKVLRSALICSLVVGAYAIAFHGINVIPNNWGSVFMWLPIYVSPIWGIAGVSYLTERGKD